MLFDAILQSGESEQDAIEYARGLVWSEVECSAQNRPTHSEHTIDVNGVGVWYDYGADYYFFEELGE
tara:strand:+ start:729 stop:929 length:201 start_codon:yes stop_codon:yes gene_type:complete